jgi:hypothetical protein
MLVQTRLLTIKEVAATLRQSERTVRGKVADGTLGLSFYPLIWGFRRCPILDAYDSEFPVRRTPVVAHAY